MPYIYFWLFIMCSLGNYIVPMTKRNPKPERLDFKPQFGAEVKLPAVLIINILDDPTPEATKTPKLPSHSISHIT